MDLDYTCPVCGSKEPYFAEVYARYKVKASIFTPTIDQVICGKCGFVRDFVKQEYLEKMRKKYERIDPSGHKTEGKAGT